MKARIKKIFDKNARERNRIAKMPRYTAGETYLLGKKIKFVDKCNYLSQTKEILQEEIYKFKTNVKTPLIIDCGANIGISVISFKKQFPNAKIIAFEPDPNIFDVLTENIKLFQFSDVELYQKAVWNTATKIKFQLEGGASGRIPKPGDTVNLIEVDSVKLSDFLDEKVDFLKIDIEGAEYEVIKGCEEKLHNVENIFIEYHSHIKEDQTLHRLLEILHIAGFRYHIQEAFVRKKPFWDKNTMLGMDLQLNIYGYRELE